MRSELVAVWLLTLTVHVGVLLVIAWVLDRGALRTRLTWRELLWRTALFGGMLTASVQTVLDMPTAVRFALPATSISSAAVQTPNASQPAHTVRPEANAPEVNAVAIAPRVAATKPVQISAPPARDLSVAARSRWLPSWQLVLIAGWLAGALLMLARFAVAWWRLERVLGHAKPLHQAAITTDVAALAIQARIAAPRVAVLEDLMSPIAARGGRIVLPGWALDLLDREQVRAMLAHETAHVARRDPVWKLATAFWCATLWFLPLAAVARRRLDEVAELACDAWAANHLGDGRSLAECLAECAEQRVRGFDAKLAPAMAHRDSPLLQRIDQLIEGTPLNTNFSRTRAGVACALALLLAAFALPGFTLSGALAQVAPPPTPPVPPAPPAPPSPPPPKDGAGRHVHISSDISLFGIQHDYTSVEVSDNGHAYSAKINGKATFNDREDDIASLSDGGTASFGETLSGTKR
ncbi:MAG: M56 family metallopeptidase, partial [Dokdonella sp.]